MRSWKLLSSLIRPLADPKAMDLYVPPFFASSIYVFILRFLCCKHAVGEILELKTDLVMGYAWKLRISKKNQELY